ncbi:MAG: heavy metal-binding domain-containing protein [Nitrospira sp.]
MKRILESLAVLVLGASVGAVAYLYFDVRRPQLESPGTEDAKGQYSYSCPTHRDVESPKPRACQKCGMALVSTNSGATAANPRAVISPGGPRCCGAWRPTPVEMLPQLPQGNRPGTCGVPGLSPL